MAHQSDVMSDAGEPVVKPVGMGKEMSRQGFNNYRGESKGLNAT